MDDGVREGGSAVEDAPPRCRPFRRGEIMYDHCESGSGERHASLTSGGGERHMFLSCHTISILDENRHRQSQV